MGTLERRCALVDTRAIVPSCQHFLMVVDEDDARSLVGAGINSDINKIERIHSKWC